MVLVVRIGQEHIDRHEANNMAKIAIFSCLSIAEFVRVSSLKTAREIWSTLERYYEGTSHVKTRLFDTHC